MRPISIELWATLVPIALSLLLVMEIFKIARRRLGAGVPPPRSRASSG
jgi:hypothetical protein